MTDITQFPYTFISHQLMTHGSTFFLEGTPLSVASFLSGTITARIANIETTANATGVTVLIMGSYDATADDAWFELARFQGSTTAAESEALTATEPVGETVLAVASTTNLVPLDTIYVQDATAVADGEWHKILQVVTNTSVTIDAGLANEKTSADTLYTEADVFPCYVNCEGLSRVNVIIVHSAATGSDLHVFVDSTFATDIE